MIISTGRAPQIQPPPLPISDDVAAELRHRETEMRETYLKLAQDPDCCDQLCQQSLQAKAGFVKRIGVFPSLARQAAIAALSSGMMCGALDALALFVANKMPLDVPGSPVMNGERDDLVQNQACLKSRSPQMLHELADQGRVLANVTVNDVQRVANDVRQGGTDWQTAQIRAFQVGYTEGVVAAVAICEDEHTSCAPATSNSRSAANAVSNEGGR